MRHTPSYLKGLRSTRARAAGDADRLRALIAELEGHLAERLAEIEACDRLIRKVNNKLDPSKIPSTRGQRRYGEHGKLKAAIREYLEAHAGEEVTTTELAVVLQAKFSLDFPTPARRKAWVANSLARALKVLVTEGLVARLHDPKSRSGQAGCWRLVEGGNSTLGEVRARAHGAGGSVVEVDAED